MKQAARDLLISVEDCKKICGIIEMPVKRREKKHLQGSYVIHHKQYEPYAALACSWVERPKLHQGFVKGHERESTQGIRRKKKPTQGREGVSQVLLRSFRKKRWKRNQKYRVCH